MDLWERGDMSGIRKHWDKGRSEGRKKADGQPDALVLLVAHIYFDSLGSRDTVKKWITGPDARKNWQGIKECVIPITAGGRGTPSPSPLSSSPSIVTSWGFSAALGESDCLLTFSRGMFSRLLPPRGSLDGEVEDGTLWAFWDLINFTSLGSRKQK